MQESYKGGRTMQRTPVSIFGSSCPALGRASTSCFADATKTWMATQLGLARVAQSKATQVGYTRLAVTSPAMTRRGRNLLIATATMTAALFALPATAQEYKIGISAGLTGYAATLDRGWRDGVEIAAA